MQRRAFLVSNILALSIVSMLAGLSTEMMQPILPLFLVGSLGASYSFVGNKAKKLIESVADDIAASIGYEIEKSGSSGNFEESLKILNSVSNHMGFASSIRKEDDNKFSIQSKNCILHKVAVSHQNIICHGLHDRMIIKSLHGLEKKSGLSVELKECIALGDSFSRHVVTN